MPGLHLWGFFTPPVAGADLPATLVANCLLGALPPVEASSDADAIAGASVGAISDADADADASSDADVIAGTNADAISDADADVDANSDANAIAGANVHVDVDGIVESGRCLDARCLWDSKQGSRCFHN